jgi:hypothetical protein
LSRTSCSSTVEPRLVVGVGGRAGDPFSGSQFHNLKKGSCG